MSETQRPLEPKVSFTEKIKSKLSSIFLGRGVDYGRRNFLKISALTDIALALPPIPTFAQETRGQSFSPELLDGVEVFGMDSPLNQEELVSLTEQLNNMELEMNSEAYYGTFFIQKSTLDNFEQTNQGFMPFLKRHATEFNRILTESEPGLSDGFVLRRLIVIDDSTWPPESAGSWAEEGIQDSDGQWNFKDMYDPNESSYYSSESQIDYGLLHEWGHAILYLNDAYSLGYEYINGDNVPLEVGIGVEAWRKYYGEDRNDNNYDVSLMVVTNGQMLLDRQSALILQRRVREEWSHDLPRMRDADILGWINELPDSVSFNFSNRGQEVEIKEIKVYKTNSTDSYNQSFNANQFTTSNSNSVNMHEIFPEAKEIVSDGGATLLLVITGDDGKKYFRWMDIRDFQIPYWQGYTDEVEMTMNVLPLHERSLPGPIGFDWTILYS